MLHHRHVVKRHFLLKHRLGAGLGASPGQIHSPAPAYHWRGWCLKHMLRNLESLCWNNWLGSLREGRSATLSLLHVIVLFFTIFWWKDTLLRRGGVMNRDYYETTVMVQHEATPPGYRTKYQISCGFPSHLQLGQKLSLLPALTLCSIQCKPT